MAKPSDTTAPLPIPAPSSSPQKKRSASSPLSNSLEEQRDFVLPLAVGSATTTIKQVVLPSRKRVVTGTTAAALPSMPAVSVSVSSSTARDVAPSLTVTAISEQSGTADVADGSSSNSVKKWGSIEQLQAAQSGFGTEMGKDSQWSMVERGTYVRNVQ